MKKRLNLFLGGARSGKSRLALAFAQNLPGPHVFIATAQAFDTEVKERIALHQAERSAQWNTVEAPLDLAEAIAAQTHGTVVVDCCTLWLSNTMLAEYDVNAACDDLLRSLSESSANIVLVSNEVGSGIVPATPLGRNFRDEQGRLNQRLAALCDRVQLVVAGIPVQIKARAD